jgi:hypothetical protein
LRLGLRIDKWHNRFDLELAIVAFGVDLSRCGGDRFTRRLPLSTQLTDVLGNEDCAGGVGEYNKEIPEGKGKCKFGLILGILPTNLARRIVLVEGVECPGPYPRLRVKSERGILRPRFPIPTG